MKNNSIVEDWNNWFENERIYLIDESKQEKDSYLGVNFFAPLGCRAQFEACIWFLKLKIFL